MLKTCKTLLRDVTSPSPTQQAIALLSQETRHHTRPSPTCPQACLPQDPTIEKTHKRVLLGAARCGRSAVEPGSGSWCAVRAAQNNPQATETRGASEKAAAGGRSAGCSCWGQARASTKHGPLPGSGQGRRAAGQRRAGSLAFCCASNNAEIQLLIQELFRTPRSLSMGQKALSTFESYISHLSLA